MPGIAQALARARDAGVDRLDAQLLLGHVVDRPRSWLLAHDDAPLDAAQRRRFDELLARRAAGEPLAYLVGEKEFHALRLRVTPDVLVPRPETELLVDWAIEQLGTMGDRPAVLDLGTGSGAIALALKYAWPAAEVTAVDASAAALAVARANGERLGLAVEWLHGDWFAPLAGRRFHVVVSNPPYVAAADPHLEALRHEPALALVAGSDGLADLRSLISGARGHLHAGGWLLLEHGHDQADAVQALLRDHGFARIETRRDLAGHARCSGAYAEATEPPR